MTQRNNRHPIILRPTADAAGAAIAGRVLPPSPPCFTSIITTTGTGTSRPGCDRA
ncbi:hypothetical protein [Marilutibacter chinensis]|uniref:Uncharacterized protein n=1 Tax=Marilutibacter chinensis TaxID=2912247 RepID=A0ABS9HWF8_9GAMM|nr:hypothetical protein [Lysobacter chinensis]MCF7223239.1 hypothetical protein [Lysobacter chinensis]